MKVIHHSRQYYIGTSEQLYFWSPILRHWISCGRHMDSQAHLQYLAGIIQSVAEMQAPKMQ